MAACFVTQKTSMVELMIFYVNSNICSTSQAESFKRVDYYLSLAAGIGKTTLVIREHSSQCLW